MSWHNCSRRMLCLYSRSGLFCRHQRFQCHHQTFEWISVDEDYKTTIRAGQSIQTHLLKQFCLEQFKVASIFITMLRTGVTEWIRKGHLKVMTCVALGEDNLFLFIKRDFSRVQPSCCNVKSNRINRTNRLVNMQNLIPNYGLTMKSQKCFLRLLWPLKRRNFADSLLSRKFCR